MDKVSIIVPVYNEEKNIERCVSGRSDVPFAEWIEMDLKYIKEAGFWVDLKLIVKTILQIIRGDGAY